MTTYGYARTSSIEQVAGLADQISKMKHAGCTDQYIFSEQISSVKMEDRAEFSKVIAALRRGDVLCVHQFVQSRTFNDAHDRNRVKGSYRRRYDQNTGFIHRHGNFGGPTYFQSVCLNRAVRTREHVGASTSGHFGCEATRCLRWPSTDRKSQTRPPNPPPHNWYSAHQHPISAVSPAQPDH